MTGTPPWAELGLRGLRPLSARTRVIEYSPLSKALLEARLPSLDDPHVGITTDGSPIPGLASTRATGVPTARIVEAAQAFLSLLTADQRREVSFPLGASEQRLWLNMHPNYLRHGLMWRGWESTSGMRRCASWRPVCLTVGSNRRATATRWSSPQFHGFGTVRHRRRPARWRERVQARTRRRSGVHAFAHRNPLRDAVFSPSIVRDALPPELHDPVDGRMQVGALNDNRVLRYEGVAGQSLDDTQRLLLRDLIGEYVGWGASGHAAVKMAKVEAHLDDTYVLWMGRVGHHGTDLLREHHRQYDHSTGTHHARH
jgi:Protein of unknown function (DUF3500)